MLETSGYDKSKETFLGDSRFSMLDETGTNHMITPTPPGRDEDFEEDATMYMEG